jgi:hypothetical protein
MSLVSQTNMAGMGDPILTIERVYYWGLINAWDIIGVKLDSATVDSRMSPTTLLSPGLVLGRVTASGEFKQYDPTATDGSQTPLGILHEAVNMLTDGVATDQWGRMTWRGPVKALALSVLDNNVRRAFYNRFIFDDQLNGLSGGINGLTVKATSYTVVAADNGTLFTTRGAAGAVTFTLPTLALGLAFEFYNEADQNMIVAAAVANTMVVFNNLTASSIAFQTASEKIGGKISVRANDNASKWLVTVNLGAEAQTVTIA